MNARFMFGQGRAFGTLLGQFAGAAYRADVFVEAVDFVQERDIDRNAAVVVVRSVPRNREDSV
ncbi:MAG: hypothetical protein ACR65R_11760 [Methylomicrobium sp.]